MIYVDRSRVKPPISLSSRGVKADLEHAVSSTGSQNPCANRASLVVPYVLGYLIYHYAFGLDTLLSLFVGLFFIMAPMAAKLLSILISHRHRMTQMPGLVAMVIVSLVRAFAWTAHAIGAPELLDGFVAGLALSRRFFLPSGLPLARDVDFADTVEQDMRPVVQLFTRTSL